MSTVYTIKEAAEKLKVCIWTVRKLIALGELKSVKIGRVYRISEKHLEAFLKAKEVGG